jgi:hypothetical protein
MCRADCEIRVGAEQYAVASTRLEGLQWPSSKLRVLVDLDIARRE